MRRLAGFKVAKILVVFHYAMAYLLFFIFIACSNKDDYSAKLEVKNYPHRTFDFSLWQLDDFYREVQMGYILRADDGKIIVIDGGGKLAAPILKQYLNQFGGKVDTWIITHPHADHMAAFLEIVKENDITITQILHVPLAASWVEKNEPVNYQEVIRYNQITKKANADLKIMRVGDEINLANGVHMQVLSAFNADIAANAINNSSLTFKITSKTKSILFLGDLGEQAGKKLLSNLAEISKIQSDYVQMSHHGQGGVNKDFYKAVNAKYALWPTPKWLWNNQLEGKNVNSGTYKTLVVRAWMEELGVSRNYVSGLEGNLQID